MLDRTPGHGWTTTLRVIGLVAVVVLAIGVRAASAQPAKAAKAAKVAKKARKAKKARPVKVDVTAEIARLDDAKADVATEAATRLGLTRDPRALTALLDALATGLQPKAAEAALRSVAEHESIKAYDVVVYYLHYRDPRVRAAAVAAIGSIDDGRVDNFVLGALHDGDKVVRAEAAQMVAERKIKRGIEPMLDLMKKGDEGVVEPLAVLADADLARVIGEQIGVAPDALVARCLGQILLKPSFKEESVRVQVVRTLGKVPGSEAVEQLTSYIEAIPEKPPRQSRREAEAIIEARLTGGM